MKGLYNFLTVADYEDAKIIRFEMLDIKVWFEDDNILYQF